MSKIEVDQITQQSGTTITVGGGACKTAVVDATTVTLGRTGATVSLACGASQSGFGRTGTVDWQTTPKTSTFTAANGEGYFADTSSGAITMNLPAGTANAIVSVADYAGTFQTNALTITPNGSDKLGGANAGKVLTTEGQSVTFVYVDSTQGWINTMDSTSNIRGEAFIAASGGTETTDGNYKIHTFNSDATFTVNSIGIGDVGTKISYVVVAGGGGASYDRSGGGGAGGFREGKETCASYTASPLAASGFTVSAQAYPITIGAGGTADNSSPYGDGGDGSNSVFSTITSTGGGGGGRNNSNPNGVDGGSGGGAGSVAPHTGRSGGAGNTPPVSPPQGNPGGASANTSPGYATGGGGGATAAGGDASGPNAGAGGAGATSSINGTPTARAGGGGGGSDNAGDGGAAGAGGGGAGGTPPSTAAAGTANTGGGAGGTSGGSTGANANNGGSGVVIIRYKYQ
jgi:hypothetical protein